ncbi:MAG: pyridoxamine kinase [Solobacterium sp.]|nr:pyridoxamine kinase [Solobacterium sp.]
MKRIATMQDISCVGKCSLTVALPVISAMGIEAAVIPTAVLSTHTMFQNFTFHDLTDEIDPIISHWKKEGFSFEALYTGYLGSLRQLDLASKLFDAFPTQFKLVDPCMADNGKMYVGFPEEFPAEMAKLCAKADIICPNLTEASFLLGIPYVGDNYDEAYVRDVLKKLTDLGTKTAILTGISLNKNCLGAYAYDSGNDTYYYYETKEEIQHFHGTGDLWASTFLGAMVNGRSLDDALRIACEFVRESIRLTLAEENHNTYGVNFEQAIPYLSYLINA